MSCVLSDYSRVFVCVMMIALLSVSVHARGDILYRLTFDATQIADGQPSADYIISPGDIVPATAAVQQMRALKKLPAQMQTATSDGFQGGQSLRWIRPSIDGFDGYIIRNSAKFYDLPADGGLTIEAIVFIDSYNPNIAGGVAGIVTSGNSGGLSPSLAIMRSDKNQPAISFGIGWHKQTVIFTSDESLRGKWLHVAGVYKRNGGNKQNAILLYINGILVAEKRYPQHPYQTFVLTGYSIANNVPASKNGPLIDGRIDAIAITDDVRDPETFVLPFRRDVQK